MKDIKSSPKFQLQIILPINHHNIDSILNEFDCTYITTEVKSIHDYGHFYSECLKAMSHIKIDMVICLGDRFEMLAAATAALLLNIPIVHLYGGETTTGAFDNEIRNSITQMASYHFTATKQYAEKVCEMINKDCYYDSLDNTANDKYVGKKVINVGSAGLDWLTRAKLLSKSELQQKVPINLDQPFIVSCFHPVTKELLKLECQTDKLMNALEKIDEQILLIRPNIDPGNEFIYKRIWRKSYYGKEIFKISNLDHLTYLSLLQYAELMVGNSSSGIIESPSFSIPSVSVGNRQNGRIKADNTFTCPCETEAILETIDRAREWNGLVGKCDNPYGDGKSTERIIKILEEI
jgi:GDP/UDP-N,N'-diacetylbacillosamine 2-epimerase (hydrolysing)